MKSHRVLLASILLACGFQARATTFATDVTDLWWNTSEGGWGVNVIHQDTALFLTFFLYGSNGAPVWYSASNVAYVTSPPGTITYSGQLFQTTGPFFGTSVYNPANVAYRQVGTVTFIVNSPTVASLTYTVDNTSVTKTLTRYTFKVNNISGVYRGVSTGTRSSCAITALNGPLDTYFTTMNVSHNGASQMSMTTVDSTAVTCNYTGSYNQDGKVGTIGGAFTCTDGRNGPWQATELEANTHGLYAKLTYSYSGGCQFTGNVAGARQ
jgi:hypothetical protein